MRYIDSIELIDGKSGRVSVRNGVTVAFFLDRHIFEISAKLLAALDVVLETFPPGSLKWTVVSATSDQWKPLDASNLKRIRESLNSEGAKKRKLTGFRMNDFGSAAPQFGFRVLDKDKDPNYPDSRTWIQITMPITWIGDDRIAVLLSLVERLVELLKPEHGYCSPSLLTSDAGQPAAFSQIRGLAMRYPGYDVDMNMMTCLAIGSRLRGARWITLLGPSSSSRIAEIAAATPLGDVERRIVGDVTWLQAGAKPELGDTNSNIKTPALCSLARLVEPITNFGEVDLLSYFAGFDEDFLRRWERRLLDQ